MTLPVSDVVQVQVQVSPTPPVAAGFGTGLILGKSTVLPLEERIRTYSSLTGVVADFAANTEEYKSSAAYFGQTPAPAQIMIGRRFLVAQAGKLRGSSGVSAVFTDYTGVSNGGFDITVNATLIQVTALNLTGAVSMAAIAALIQTKLAAGLASTTCTWTGTYFLITSPTTGPTSLVTFASAPTGGGAPVDVSTLLGFTNDSGALAVNGIAIETCTDSLNASIAFNNNWYGLSLTADRSTQDVKDAAAFAEPNKKLHWYSTADANAKLAVATSDLLYFMKNLGYQYTVGFYSGSPNAHVSAMARAFVVDFSQPDSTITMKFKQLPGVGVDTITEAERLAIEGKNGNWYSSVGGFAMIANGVVANGRFIDEVHGLDWLQATVQNAVFAILATAIKVPLTNAGVARLIQAATGAFKQAKSNGLVAPGTWTGQNLGEVKSGDFLEDGFYIYAPSVATLSVSDRALRKSPPITAICIGAGAIHTVSLTVVFQR